MKSYERNRISEIMAKKAIGSVLSQEDNEILDKWIEQSSINKEIHDRLMSGESYAMRHRADRTEFTRKVENRIQKRNLRRRMIVASLSTAAVLAIGLFSAVLMNNSDLYTEATDPAILANQYQAIMSFEGSERILLRNESEENEWQEIIKAQIENQNNNEPDSIVTIKIEVPRGNKYKVQLDDGTLVWLNAETTIKYPSKFKGDRRNVHVSGEAYFEVAHNPAQPFTVTTEDDLHITVLGTKFNVNSYSDASEVQVTLAEGSVEIRQKNNNCILTPSRQAIFSRDNGQLAVQEVDVSRNISWINGIFDFRSKTLPEIYNELAKWYDVEFIIEDVVLSGIERFTLTADRGADFTHVEDILRKITGLDYRIDGHKIYVSRKK